MRASLPSNNATKHYSYNLDIRSFAFDIVDQCESPSFIKAFYHIIQNVTILDPTCGSGAFLFAALNILEPLYEICISKMEDYNREDASLFASELDEISNKYRSNVQYFIYKSIILRNLYGVDPLPDVDFNIRCGNTLVGYATEEELNHDLEYAGDFLQQLANQELKDNDLLKHHLHASTSQLDYAVWLESHKPFNWLAEFYQIMHGQGGFDVITGNPPLPSKNRPSISGYP